MGSRSGWDQPSVQLIRWPNRGRNYHTITARHGGREVEVTFSSTGRSVQVHLDGKRMVEGDDE